MEILPFEEKRNRVLLAAYKIHTTKTQHIHIDELGDAAGVGREVWNILRVLGANGKGWLKKSGNIVRFTAEGIEKAEELEKMRIADKERLILETIYELGGPTHMDLVPIETLERKLGINFRELNAILLDFERKRGWVEGPDEAVQLTPAGVREVENPGGDRHVGVKYETHFHAPFQGGFNQGPGGTQHINIQNTKNEFDDAIYTLLKAVEQSSRLSAVQRMTVAGDIRTVQQLGQLEHTPEVIEAASSKIEGVNSVISSTADMVSIGMVVIPIIRAFFGL